MDAATRETLRAALLDAQLCGDTLTPRESVVRNAKLLAAGDPDKLLGFSFPPLTEQSVIDDVAALCGCSNDLSMLDGPGVIDVDRTLDGLAAAAGRLAQAARRGQRVLLATGHPTGLMPSYMTLARALQAAGCKTLTPRSGERLNDLPRRHGNRVRYLDSVAVLTDGANLYHTHESWPMEMLLDSIDAPDLVVADHGFAGAAIVRGVSTIAFTDVNDPAIAVALARGMTRIVVPLDDNREPERYLPMTEFLVQEVRA
ncbi:MAG: phosphatase [Gemmatimonadales bacterium]